MERIALDPSVLPWTGDARAWERKDVLGWGTWLLCEQGMFLLEHPHERQLAIHVGVLPEGRGEDARRHMREAIDYAFDHFDIDAVVGHPKRSNIAAMLHCQRVGFEFVATVNDRAMFEIRRARWERMKASCPG